MSSFFMALGHNDFDGGKSITRTIRRGMGPRNESFLAAELGIQWAIFLIFSLWMLVMQLGTSIEHLLPSLPT